MAPVRIYYDCEFIEDGRTIDLISIGMASSGMASSDCRELYRVTSHAPTIDRALLHPWLRENVVPSLPVIVNGDRWEWDPAAAEGPHGVVRDRETIRQEVTSFIIKAGRDVELWADYGAYDHICLAQLFGTMIDFPAGFPMWTNDLRTLWLLHGKPDLPRQAKGIHNALADARHSLDLGEFFRLRGRPTY